MNSDLTYIIKREAQALGFSFCSVAQVVHLDSEADYFRKWLNNNYNADMDFMQNHFDKRTHPALLFDNAKAVICVGLNYFINPKVAANNYKIAKFAYGTDYHYILKERLNKIINIIKEKHPDINARAFVDSAPVMDKAWAQRSGIGWIGKNTCVINKKIGSFFFLGEIIIDIDLEYDKAETNHCGNCTK